ncbi:MAG: hypothetical protein R2750_09465 [Bacteroidales bacterium]
MNLDKIEEIYKYSDNRYSDLFDYFLNYCGYEILSTRLTIGFETMRIRDYKTLSEIKSKEDVKYPPSSTNYTRIGKPNQIWFYISDNLKASLAEMLPIWYSKINPGENINVVLSTWQIRQPIKVMIIPDLNNINIICKNLDLEAYHKNKDFWEYICKKFTSTTLDSKNIYEFTSAFANSLMERANIDGKNVDGIFYPSIQYPSQSNIALIPSTVDLEKIVLMNLFRAVFFKSRILNFKGTPNYDQLSDFKQGFYEPDKDKIEWPN